MIVYGATVFPIKSWWAGKGYNLILKNAKNILVRDQGSYEALINIGISEKMIQIGSDLRYILSVQESSEIKNILSKEGVDTEQPIISISTRYFDNHMPQWVKSSHGFDAEMANRANKAFAKIIDNLGQYGQLVLIPMHPHMEEDLETAYAIQQEMHNPKDLIVLKNRYQVEEILQMIKMSKILVTGRVGSVLFASITATPTLAIAYDGRTSELMNDLGLQDYVFDWKNINYQDLVTAAEKLLQERDHLSKILHQKAVEFRSKATDDSMLYKCWLES
jgi:colanic acid/amylovoran biosynthesis protein